MPALQRHQGLTGLISGFSLGLGLSLGACGKKATNPTTPSPDPQITADARPVNLPGAASRAGVFRAQLDWSQPPAVEAYAAATVTLTDAAGAAVKSADALTFVPFMPTMGHGTAMREQTITPLAGQAGLFKVDKVFFTMGGAWVIKISATVNGKADTADVAVNL